ncbi:hypothetical protein [Pararhizobium mangrovi]|uniref:Uncharacterized protein n=1 Tax=Pararhizobium mangrovi TaxID=2590452 RepID=A0A506TWH8_9HYPH|nr:hypothetical protein [Pararhizobium mangrovi]TPW25840.1 hypothetical protein FJU11_17580 [Pararhizobium mangrovi]
MGHDPSSLAMNFLPATIRETGEATTVTFAGGNTATLDPASDAARDGEVAIRRVITCSVFMIPPNPT